MQTTLNMCFNYDASLKQAEIPVIRLSALKTSSKINCFACEWFSYLRVEGFLQTEPLMVETALLLCKLVLFTAPPVTLLGIASW